MEICEDEPQIGDRVKIIKSNDPEGVEVIGMIGNVIHIQDEEYTIEVDGYDESYWVCTIDELEVIW